MTTPDPPPRADWHPAVKLLYALGILVCLGLAGWGVVYWIPRLGWPGVLWTLWLLGIAAFNAYSMLARRRGSGKR